MTHIRLTCNSGCTKPMPDARIATLTLTFGTWVASVNQFSAPAGTTLKADTTYFLFLSNSGSDTSAERGFQLPLTASTSADDGGAPGWSLGKWTNRTRSPQGSWTTPYSIGLIQFAIGGSYVVYPDPPGQNVSEPDGGDCASNNSTQCRVAVGGSVTGTSTNRDIDAFAVELLEGETYRIDLEGVDTGQGTLTDPVVKINDLSSSDVTLVEDDNSGEGNNAQATFTPNNSRTFYVIAEGARDRNTGGTETGTYRLTVRNVRNISVSEPDGEDFLSTESTTGRVAVGGSVTGNIESDTDVDWFKVDLEVGHTYQIDVEGADTNQGTLADPKLVKIWGYFVPNTIAGVPDTTNSDRGEGKNARDQFTLPDGWQAGTYFISVSGQNDATGTYRLSVREAVGSGYGRTYLLEGRLRVGGELSGTLGVPTDYGTNSYYFALEDLEVGRYTVDFGTGTIDSIHATLRRDGQDDTMITRAEPDPTGRKGIDSHSFDVRPGMEGTHYVLLEMRMGDSGNYTATLEKVRSSLRVGGSVRGDLPSSSNDPEKTLYGFVPYMEFFSVDLQAGRTYRLDIEGEDTCDDCTMDYTMLNQVQAPDGSFVGRDGNFDDSDGVAGSNNLFVYGGGEGRNTRFTFTADQDGTHFLKVGGRLFSVSDKAGASSRYRAGTFKVSIRRG